MMTLNGLTSIAAGHEIRKIALIDIELAKMIF